LGTQKRSVIRSFQEATQARGIRKAFQTNDLLKGTIALKDFCLLQTRYTGNQGIDNG
jgi:hypothetical protein